MKTIMFYGNCQLAGIGYLFSQLRDFSKHYRIIRGIDYNLPSQSGEGFNIAHFQLNNHPHFPDLALNEKNLKLALDATDILVFQSLNPSYGTFSTDCILENYTGSLVCIPSFWFGAYSFSPVYPFIDLLMWMVKNNMNKSQIKGFLLNEDHQIFYELISYYYKLSLDGIKCRAKNDSKKFDYINIEKWIESTWESELLCYNPHHPTWHYFKYMTMSIINTMNMEELYFDLKSIDHINKFPDSNGYYVYPGMFHFFKKRFPKMVSDLPRYIDGFNHTDESLDEFINNGLKFISDCDQHNINSINNVLNTLDIS